MAAAEREFDVVLWGASGFTGRLVAEYLFERHGAAGELRWALGGRNAGKLEAVRATLGAGAEGLPLVVGDGDDEAFLAGLVQRARVVCTTVGPYALHGSKLVAACAGAGTDYCDLTGELPWMRRMIDAHEATARASGARIVHTCGFDCIPSDLGVFFLQREMRARHGTPSPRIKYRVKDVSAAVSGGTLASLLNVLDEAGRDPEVRRLLDDPYALDPEGRRRGRDGPDQTRPVHDADFEQWTAPFAMAMINTRVVRRTNALLGDRGEEGYGEGFRYDEATLTGSGALGLAKAAAMSAAQGAGLGLAALAPVRRLLSRVVPAPGEGPSQEQREKGFFEIELYGAHPEDRGKSLRARVTGDRDPGYGSTAKMLGESAVCLARDELAVGGGFWTPAAAMGDALLERLRAHAGLTFGIESS